MLHTLVQSLTALSGQLSASKQYTAGAGTEFDETIPASTTNAPVSLAIDISQVKSLIILSDQIVTIKTNSSGSPTDTIVTKAGVPYIWNTDSYDNCKVTADVTTAFITNGTANAARVQIAALFDPTP